MITLENVSKVYGKGSNKVDALKDINLKIEDDEFVSIVGASGCGKTTLLNVVSTIDKLSSGIVSFNNNRIDNLNEKEKSLLRLERFGFIFQKFYLLQTVNVYDNILMPVAFSNKKIHFEYIDSIIDLLGLYEKKNMLPNCLSGGEQQRVAIARALVNNPDVLFADEPTGNLDSKNGMIVLDYLIKISKEYNKCVIFVTHDSGFAKMADSIVEMKDGAIIGKH